jgi:two-component system, OmpR family, phosphate regulon sensor histidine kinase PhoR
MVVVHDISERKRNEKALIEARAQINMILSSMQDIVFMFDSEGVFRFCQSPAGSALYLPAQEFIGKNYAQIMPPQVTELLKNALKENKNGRTSEIEYPLEIRGVYYVFLAKLSPILSSGSYQGSVAVVRDITERKKHAEQLRNERKKLRQYINICSVIFVVINSDGKVSLVNKAGCEMLGSNEEDIVGKNWFDNFIPESERNMVKNTFNKLMNGEIDPVEEFRNEILRKDGSIRKVMWRNTILKDEHGLITGTLSAGEDITERLSLLEQAQMAVKAKEQFMATISHELRTPLASIKEGISAVLDGVSGEIKKDQRSLLQISKRNVDRLARLINNVLDLQKMDLGQMKFIYEETDIPSLINEVYESMLPLARKKNLDMTKQVRDGLPKIQADKDKLSQVLANLIGNAIHATEKGSITISGMLEGGNIKLCVKDTGKGIRQEDLPKLFQRFSQIKRRFGGTGLGLAISKEIVDAHKGAIWAESKEGQGSSFMITLPAG